MCNWVEGNVGKTMYIVTAQPTRWGINSPAEDTKVG